MSLYDEIISPLDDDQTIMKLLEAFDKSAKAIYMTEEEWGNNLRRKLISGESVDSEKYKNEMVKYVEKDALETLFNNIKTRLENKPEYFEDYDRQVESMIEDRKKRIEEKYKGDDDFEIHGRIIDSNKSLKDKYFMYQISKFKNLILSSNFDELYRAGKYKDEVCKDLFQQLRKSFLGEKGVMGFHITPEKMLQPSEKKKDEIKFYINAGIDTYKFASLFRKQCEENNMYYYFKVVGKSDDEFNREDKMCIYSTYEDAEKYVEIIKKIAKENLDIMFENPPVLNGKIDNFIGVGTDHIGDGRGSYNQKMCDICSAAIRSVYSEWTKEKIMDDGRKFYDCDTRTPFMEYAKKHPEKIKLLKEEIKKRAKEIGLDEEKICVVPELRPGYEQKDNSPKIVQENNNATKEQNNGISNSPNDDSKNQEQDIRDFVLKFVESYRHLEKNSQYDKRLDREESDIEYVADYVNKYRANKLDGEYFLGIQTEVLDKYGRMDFSQDSIDRMFRMLNSANNLTVGNQQYLRDFCESPEIQNLLKQMQESPAVQDMISRAEIDKKMGNPGGRGSLRGETPAERDVHLARKGFKDLKESAKASGRDDNYVFNTIIEDFRIKFGYEREEEFALAKVCCKQRGIKTQSRDLQGKYKLDIVDQTQNQDLIDPQTVKQDTIVAGINLSEINRYIREVKDQFLNLVKGENVDKNR